MEGKSERRTRKIRGVMKNGDQSETVNRSYFCAKNDRREEGMNTQWIALIISLLGFLASVYYSNKNRILKSVQNWIISPLMYGKHQKMLTD